MKKILFVEDEKILQEKLGKRLQDKGYQVIPALDGETGLRLARQENPNLILLDIMLPLKNGFEVLKELKADKETRMIPVIVLTNLESIEEVEKALELGATTYLVKTSYNLEEVIEKIETTFSEKYKI